jgi:hypothetical protein
MTAGAGAYTDIRILYVLAGLHSETTHNVTITGTVRSSWEESCMTAYAKCKAESSHFIE